MLTIMLLGVALAEPLASSELPNTAHTLPKGAGAIHIFGTSGVGVTDALELKASLLGLLGGPNLGAEYAFQEGKKGAMSVGVSANSNWRFTTQSFSGTFNYTMGGPLENRLNLSAGGGYARGYLRALDANGDEYTYSVAGPSTLIAVGYDVVPKPRTAWQFAVSLDPYHSVQGRTFSGVASATWNHSWDVARVRLGAVIIPTGEVQQVLDDAGLGINLPPVLPLPTFDVWWRF